LSKPTLLSRLLEGAFVLPAASLAPPAGMLATTAPTPLIPVTLTV
jgi:hypothetical protein